MVQCRREAEAIDSSLPLSNSRKLIRPRIGENLMAGSFEVRMATWQI
jgi:hypothetical protein